MYIHVGLRRKALLSRTVLLTPARKVINWFEGTYILNMRVQTDNNKKMTISI